MTESTAPFTIGRLSFDSPEALEADLVARARADSLPHTASWSPAEWYTVKMDDVARAAMNAVLAKVMREQDDPRVLGCALLVRARRHLPYLEAVLQRLEAGSLPEDVPLPGKSLGEAACQTLIDPAVAKDPALNRRAIRVLAARGRPDKVVELLCLGDPEGALTEWLVRCVEEAPRRVNELMVESVAMRLAQDDTAPPAELLAALRRLAPAVRQRFLDQTLRSGPQLSDARRADLLRDLGLAPAAPAT